jgi:hypothetical protein
MAPYAKVTSHTGDHAANIAIIDHPATAGYAEITL